MADYPAAYYDPREKENKPGIVYDPTKKTIIFVEDFNSLEEEILAIEAAIGLDPGNLRAGAITFIIDGGGAATTTGQKGHLEIPYKCEIQKVTLLADQEGDIKIDIWKNTYANFPPTNDDSICAGDEPEIVADIKYQDAILTDWIKTINAGDILALNVDSANTIQRLTLVLEIKKIT